MGASVRLSLVWEMESATHPWPGKLCERVEVQIVQCPENCIDEPLGGCKLVTDIFVYRSGPD